MQVVRSLRQRSTTNHGDQLIIYPIRWYLPFTISNCNLKYNFSQNQAEGHMPPPNKQGTVKKKRPKDWPQPLISAPTLLHHSNSFNGRQVPPALIENKDEYENDSDSAYGFGNNWQSS